MTTMTIFLTTAACSEETGEDGLSVYGAYSSHKKAAEALATHIVELFSDEEMDETEIRETLESGYPYDMGDIRFNIETTDLHN